MMPRLRWAPGAMPPELAGFLSPCRVYLARWPSAGAVERHGIRLLTEHPNRSCHPPAPAPPAASERQLDVPLTVVVGDERDLVGRRVQAMRDLGPRRRRRR